MADRANGAGAVPSIPPDATLRNAAEDRRLATLGAAGLLDAPARARFDRLARSARRLLRAPVGLVSLVGADRQSFLGASGLPEPWAGRRETPISHSFCRWVVRAGRPLVVRDAREDLRVSGNPAIRDLGVVAYLGVPLALPDGSGLALGALCAIDHRPRDWTEEDAEALADLAGTVVAESAAREGEARLRLAQEAAGAGTWELDFVENLCRFSPESARLHGLSADQAQAFDEGAWDDLIHPGDCAPARAAVARAVAERGLYDFTFRVPLPDGSVRWVQGLGRAEYAADGRPLRMLGLNFDVTARKAAEAALRESEAQFRAAFEQSSVPMSQVDCATERLLRVNPAYCALLGRPAAELVGRPFSEFVHPNDRDADVEGFRRMCRGEAPSHRVLKRYVRPDGSVRWAELSSSPVRDGAGRMLRTVAVATDVTDRRRAEEALRRSEERLRLAIEGARLGTWEVDLRAGTITRSPRMLEIFGFASDEEVGAYPGWRHRIHPEDRDRVIGTIEATRAGRMAEYRVEYRFHRPDGRWAWVESHGRAIREDRTADGAPPVRLAGTTQDITERKLAEEALRESEERLRLATEGARVGIWELDLATGRGRWSAEASALFGVDREAFTVEDWTEAVHPEDRATAAEAWRQTIEEGAPHEVEFRAAAPAPDGSERWLLSRGRVERDAAGRPARGIGILLDVTGRVTAEAATREALAELRAVYETAPVGMCVLDVELRWTRINARMAEMNGLPPEAHIGRGVRELLPDIADVAEALQRRVMETGEPALGIEIEGETPARPGVRRVWEESWFPLRDSTGRIVGVNVVADDVTERKAAERRQALLMRELDHRAKNTLAVVQAAVRLTPKGDPEAYARAVEGRVNALARAHTLLAQGRWTGAELRDVVAGELRPFLSGAGVSEGAAASRVELRGPDVALSPAAAQALSMALHELATNATKYGALSAPGGRVSVSWQVDKVAGTLHLRWSEAGGPRLQAPPARRGFGSRVIEATLRDQLGGCVDRHWEAEGLVCEVGLPLGRVLAERDGGTTAKA